MEIPAKDLLRLSIMTGAAMNPGFCRIQGAICMPMTEGNRSGEPPRPGDAADCHCPMMCNAEGSVPGSPACAHCRVSGVMDSTSPDCPAGAGS